MDDDEAAMRPTNLLFLLSDEHQRDVAGCYGNTVVRTPHLDALAARGTRFTAAYTPCPICVPARAALATGRYVHETGHWDNAHPYAGEPPGWGHVLQAAGHRVASIGKLHYRDTSDDNGFDEEILPMHVLEGIGDLLGLVRAPPAARGGMLALSETAGPGVSSYSNYDVEIARQAEAWLERIAARPPDKPWVLFVSFVRPHFPLIAPDEFFALYDLDAVPWPRLYDKLERPTHPAVRALRDVMNYDDFFDPVKVRRAIAAYYALITFLDRNIGTVLAALERTGLSASTRVLYTSDHGDNLGNRGLWGKSVMYEESAAVPLILAGPEVAQGAVVDTPVSLVDCHRSIIEATGCPIPERDATSPSRSLWRIAAGERPERNVLSEYHAAGSVTGTFMIREGRWKYIHHTGYRPELFDLAADPGETRDLAEEAGHEAVLVACHAKLCAICDPDAVTARAFADQRAKIEDHGGVEAILKRGDFGHTPAPGEKASFA
jgi:choline-sulfatase